MTNVIDKLKSVENVPAPAQGWVGDAAVFGVCHSETHNGQQDRKHEDEKAKQGEVESGHWKAKWCTLKDKAWSLNCQTNSEHQYTVKC